jgi:hypothetical protein
MASAPSVRVDAWRHRPMGGRAPGPMRPISSARQTSHQRVSVLGMRKPPKSPGFRETAGGGASHLNGACRIRDESFGQPSVEQETADALESRGSALSASGSRRIAQRNFTRRLSNSEPSISSTFWIQLCSLRLLAPPHTSHSHYLMTSTPARVTASHRPDIKPCSHGGNGVIDA